MDSNKIAHLSMIQGVINRMAGNSARMKGWTVTLIAAVFALAAKDADIRYILIAFIPAGAFWMLDAFYLQQERLFRDLYSRVSKQSENEITFSMDRTEFNQSYVSSFFAMVNLLFYSFLISSILFAMFAFPLLGN